jgi:ribose 5-phosphate isomerase B
VLRGHIDHEAPAEARGSGPLASLDVRIAFGTDLVTAVTEHAKAKISALGHEVVVIGEGDVWPDIGRGVGDAVAAGRADLGVVCCWTGTGVSIAANKVNGVRAALCTDAATAAGARRWNDANVLAVGLRLTTEPLFDEMIDAFLQTTVQESELGTIARIREPS